LYSLHVEENMMREQLGLKEETDTFMVTAAEERYHSEPEAGSDLLITNTSCLAVSHDQEGSTDDAQNFPQSQSNTNTGKKSLKCDGCRKSFTHKSLVHLRVHTGEKPYICKTCDKRFTASSSLKKHSWLHSGETPYSCKTCGKGFATTSSFTLHSRIHAGDKPYSCKTCRKSFSTKSSLKIHSRSHSGEKPYSCETCEKRFSTTSSLKMHARLHSREKPYSCKTWENRSRELFIEKTKSSFLTFCPQTIKQRLSDFITLLR
uniref:C2H2-type domain-containing protein n=1 Tax=Oreochromis niloticus TaxID=8128 RepID=A0A669CM95_ORENI